MGIQLVITGHSGTSYVQIILWLNVNSNPYVTVTNACILIMSSIHQQHLEKEKVHGVIYVSLLQNPLITSPPSYQPKTTVVLHKRKPLQLLKVLHALTHMKLKYQYQQQKR